MQYQFVNYDSTEIIDSNLFSKLNPDNIAVFIQKGDTITSDNGVEYDVIKIVYKQPEEQFKGYGTVKEIQLRQE